MPKTRDFVARYTIYDASKMTKAGKISVATWLRKAADFLEKNGDQMSNRFTGKYMVK